MDRTTASQNRRQQVPTLRHMVIHLPEISSSEIKPKKSGDLPANSQIVYQADKSSGECDSHMQSSYTDQRLINELDGNLMNLNINSKPESQRRNAPRPRTIRGLSYQANSQRRRTDHGDSLLLLEEEANVLSYCNNKNQDPSHKLKKRHVKMHQKTQRQRQQFVKRSLRNTLTQDQIASNVDREVSNLQKLGEGLDHRGQIVNGV